MTRQFAILNLARGGKTMFAVHKAGCRDIAKTSTNSVEEVEGDTAEKAAETWSDDAYDGEVQFRTSDYAFFPCTKAKK